MSDKVKVTIGHFYRDELGEDRAPGDVIAYDKDYAARLVEGGVGQYADVAASDTTAAGNPAVTTDAVAEPPRGGPGSGRDEWAAYAASLGVEVEADMNRDDIIDAVDNRE